MKVIQFVYSKCFPEIYSLIDKPGINLKSEFLFTFKLWKDKKKFGQTTSVTVETAVNNKKPENEKDLEKTLVDVNGEKVSEKLNEKKLKRKVLAEKNTGLKEATKKRRKSAPTEKELWDCLDILNQKFMQAKEHKKLIKDKINCIVLVCFVIMSYYSLQRLILNENKETKKLNNLSSNYQRLSYKQQARDLDKDIPSLVAQSIVSEGVLPLTDGVQNFLLGTSEYANDIQSDIDLFVTKGRFNEASIRHKLDPIVKSVWKTENPLVCLFKDVATFDAQNPIIGSLLRKTDLAKKGKKAT